jgi:hypothetical protein
VAFTFSIDLPDSVSDLVNSAALDQYTKSGQTQALESKLQSLTADDLFPGGVLDEEMASACLSGLWLLHNFLEQSHEISQEIHSPEGSFWHAIMHRLEGDFSNSKYWYRKVGAHPVFESLANTGTWDPFEFVDQCESAKNGNDAATQKVHQAAVNEWKTLFEYCFEQASR